MRAGPAVAALGVFLLAASLVAAQPRRGAPASPLAPEVFGGYSFTHAGEANLHGLGFSSSYPVTSRFSVVLDLSGHDGSFAGADLDQLGLLAGVRFSPSAARLRPFAEALLGGVRTSVGVEVGGARVSHSDSDWGFALGGGGDYRIRGRWSLRGLLHLRLLSGEGTWDTDPRIAVGVSYRLGR